MEKNLSLGFKGSSRDVIAVIRQNLQSRRVFPTGQDRLGAFNARFAKSRFTRISLPVTSKTVRLLKLNKNTELKFHMHWARD